MFSVFFFILSAAKRIWFALVVIILVQEGKPLSISVLLVLCISISSSIIIVSMVMSSLIFIVSGDSSSSSIIIVSIVFSFFGVESFTLKSMNGSFFCFVSFILSLETSVMVYVSLLSNRSSSIQISSVPTSLKGFFFVNNISNQVNYFYLFFLFSWCVICLVKFLF